MPPKGWERGKDGMGKEWSAWCCRPVKPCVPFVEALFIPRGGVMPANYYNTTAPFLLECPQQGQELSMRHEGYLGSPAGDESETYYPPCNSNPAT